MTTNNKNIDKQGKKLLNVPNLRFPEFEGEWEKMKLKDVCSFFSGGTPSSTNKSYYDGDIPFIRSGEIGAGSTELFLSELGLNNSSAKIVEVGDLLLALYGATSGQIAISKIKGAINQAILCIRSSHNNVFFKSTWEKRVGKILQAFLQGGQGNLSAEIVKSLTFYFPKMQEQNKIAYLISLIEERIETQSRIIEDLKQLRSAITNRIIYNLVADKKLVPFSEIYQMAGEGGTPNTNNRQYYEGGTIPFIKIDDLSSKYLTRNKDFITEIGLQKSSAWVIPANSLIYSNGATIGAVSINTYKVVTKQGILGIVPKSTVCVEYLYYLTTSTFFKKQIHRIITYGTMTTAYLKDINKIKVPLPDIEEQNKVIKGLITLSEKIEKEQEILANFQAQKKYLLHQMFI